MGWLFADTVFSVFSPLVLTMGELPLPLYLLLLYLSSSSSLSSFFSSTFLAADKETLSIYRYVKGTAQRHQASKLYCLKGHEPMG